MANTDAFNTLLNSLNNIELRDIHLDSARAKAGSLIAHSIYFQTKEMGPSCPLEVQSAIRNGLQQIAGKPVSERTMENLVSLLVSPYSDRPQYFQNLLLGEIEIHE